MQVGFKCSCSREAERAGRAKLLCKRDTSESASSGNIGLRESLTRDGAGGVDYHTSR